MTNFRACLVRLDDVASSKAHHGELDDRVIMLYCPGSYETALQGMELELAKVREDLDSNNNHQKEEKLSFGNRSTSNAARSAADAAVQKSLLRDVQMDNGQAVPSDAWLDHASMGLGVGRALEATNEQRSVPLLLGEDIRKGEMEYQRILDTLVVNASVTKEEGLDRLESFEESPGGSSYRGGDDESVYSVTSQMSTMSVASSTRMTAGQRKRWHKQQMQSMKARTKSSSTQMMHHPMLSTHNEASSQTSAVAGRQQSLVGSHPYLCEVFHDSYGIGPEPPKGLVECSGFSARCTREGGTEFYPPSSHITDLLVFNTTRSSYGLAKSATLAVGAPSSGAKSGKETGDLAREAVSGHPVSPTSAARKSQLLSGVNKPSLANLVFKADAHAEAKVALDLPASLPRGLSG